MDSKLVKLNPDTTHDAEIATKLQQEFEMSESHQSDEIDQLLLDEEYARQLQQEEEAELYNSNNHYDDIFDLNEQYEKQLQDQVQDVTYAKELEALLNN